MWIAESSVRLSGGQKSLTTKDTKEHEGKPQDEAQRAQKFTGKRGLDTSLFAADWQKRWLPE
jgi:hypothetical protein